MGRGSRRCGVCRGAHVRRRSPLYGTPHGLSKRTSFSARPEDVTLSSGSSRVDASRLHVSRAYDAHICILWPKNEPLKAFRKRKHGNSETVKQALGATVCTGMSFDGGPGGPKMDQFGGFESHRIISQWARQMAKKCANSITSRAAAKSHVHIQITHRAGVVYSFELRMMVQLQDRTARKNHKAGTTTDQTCSNALLDPDRTRGRPKLRGPGLLPRSMHREQEGGVVVFLQHLVDRQFDKVTHLISGIGQID